MYDFIVVGAGPAGSSAAERLAKEGMKVLVIEKRHNIGMPVQCGEGMSTYQLERIGMRKGEHIVWEGDDVELIFPSGSIFVRQSMVSIDRSKLDRELVDRGLSEGAELKTGERVGKISKSASFWKVNTEKSEYYGRYLIGADGYLSVVGKSLGLYEMFGVITGTSTRGMKNGVEDHFKFYFSSEYPHGYAYVFPRGGGLVNAGVVLKGRNIRQANDVFLRKNEIRPIENRGGGIPFLVKLKRYYGWRAMLVGDAAGLTNSITYGGIYAAIMSGRLSAKAGTHAIEKGMEFPKSYEKDLKKSDFFQRNSEKDHNMVYQMKEGDMELLGKIAGGRYLDEVSVMSSFAKIVRSGRIGALPRMLRLYRYFLRNSRTI